MSGEPFLAFARPSITDGERAAVLDVLDSGWLTTGPRTQAFAEAFAAFVAMPHAVPLNSATAGLHLALEALGIGPGDEVIVPTWTFTSTAEVVTYLGARPVLVDIDPVTLNADPDAVRAAITPRTRVFMAVHVAGLPMAIGPLVRELEERGIAVVEDAAHAFPSRIAAEDGRLAGTIGRVGVFSFYATKTITTGEGGMLVTRDTAIADRARQMSLHGISRDAWKRYTAAGSWYYEVEAAGFKYNMTDLAAALGIVQLSRADELLVARRALAARYRSALTDLDVSDALHLPPDATDGSHAWHLFILRLRLDRLTLGRNAVIDALRERGIGTSVHFIPLHRHPYYRRTWLREGQAFPRADHEFERVISLPIWPGMTDGDVDRVVAALGDVLRPALLSG